MAKELLPIAENQNRLLLAISSRRLVVIVRMVETPTDPLTLHRALSAMLKTATRFNRSAVTFRSGRPRFRLAPKSFREAPGFFWTPTVYLLFTMGTFFFGVISVVYSAS